MMCLKTMMVCSLRQQILPILGLLLIIECIISLKLLELRVPSHVPLGTRAELSCSWQLGEHDVLYSVKWYKDGREFFRHVPRDLEPRRKFPLPGVDVETFDTSGGNVTLSPAVLETGGRYRCEVSGERPLFPTVSDHADMLVVVLPDHGPMISGFRSRYRTGDRVQVNCTSGRSRPATQLAWYINGEPAPASAVQSAIDKKTEDLETTSMALDFVVQETDFKKNGLKIKCLATLAPVYWRSNEESALKEKAISNQLLRSSLEDVKVTRADRVLANSAEFTNSWRHVVLLLCSMPNLFLRGLVWFPFFLQEI
ncbi:uncharacterized protein LOC126368070 [Pectinophora gossypiella]|uniref:uncharacterized protein LOC126368070 n=1 Tax=Pectinophora gossypiella TaxID=13191 RepID=UPI00214F366A|nr:uncharacterized protein LOC126368070 [Pectinophora gossypiella]XP_049867908.1 uncharacterized protein LOC126368070 [Pectinophora gossypiella]